MKTWIIALLKNIFVSTRMSSFKKVHKEKSRMEAVCYGTLFFAGPSFSTFKCSLLSFLNGKCYYLSQFSSVLTCLDTWEVVASTPGRLHRIHMFSGFLDPDPSITKHKSKKSLDSYCFETSFWLFIFENDVQGPSKSNKQKNFFKKLVFCWYLGKVNDENSRIRIRIRIRIWIRIH